MQRVTIDCSRIIDVESFHDVFADAFGFPEFYGRKMDAWIDCVGHLDQDNGMTKVRIDPGETLLIVMQGGQNLHERLPELSAAVLECVAFVNGATGDNTVPARPTALVAVAWT